jgi:ferredoxin
MLVPNRWLLYLTEVSGGVPILRDAGYPSAAFDMTARNLSESSAVKLVINTDICTGHARCVALTPELFDDDENGYGHVIGDGIVADALEAKARTAMQACPERAISLID